MSWHDPKGPWSRKLGLRIRLQLLVCVVLVLASAVVLKTLWGTAPLLHDLGGGGMITWIFPLGFGLPVLISLVVLGTTAHRFYLDRTVLREVPKRDGYLCPRCRRALPQELPEGDCPRCQSHYARAELQAYWVDYVLAPQRLRAWGTRKSWWRKLVGARDRLRDSLRAQIVYEALILVVGLAFFWWLTGFSFAGLLWRYLPLLIAPALFGLGISCLYLHRRRVGSTQHCAACNYQRSPQGEDPERCPECGADWSRPGGVISGTPPRSSRQLAAAVGLIVIAALLMAVYVMSLLPGSNWTVRTLPTTALIRDAASHDGFTTSEWTEILRRQLTHDQTLQLAAGLLDKRMRTKYLNPTEGGWLWTQVAAGALPDDLAARYYGEMLDLWLDAPARATVGSTMAVSLGATYRYSNPGVGIDELVYFGGFFVGGEPMPLVHNQSFTHGILLEERPFRAEIPVDRPGPLHVRAVLYFAVGPGLGRAPLAQWNDDGTATLPASTVWSRRIELDKTIEVGD